MTGPIYKLWMMKANEAWYQLSPEEQASHMTKINEAFAKVGGKQVIQCDATAFSEQWSFFGVSEYPDLAALQAHQRILNETEHVRYVTSITILGTKAEWDEA